MSTVLPVPDGSPYGQETPGDAPAGKEFPAKSAVVIYGRLNYLALGTLIAVAKSFAGNVFVVADRDDDRIVSLARSLGARRIVPGRPDALEVVFDHYAPVIAMCGDGSHDPSLIPDLLHGIREGLDAAIVPPPAARGSDEKALLLNHRQPAPVSSGFVALSGPAARGLRLKKGEGLGQQMAGYARAAGLQTGQVGGSGNDDLRFRAYRIGVVVPAYNEELLLGETVRGIPGYVSRIYVIDDASTDRTSEIVKSLDDPRVVALRHDVNRGVGGSIVDGYRMALRDGMDLVAVMAGDDQMDPAELPKLLVPVIEGETDYAKGNRLLNRVMRKGMSPWRQLGNGMLTMLNKVASGYWHVSDPQNGYTVISRRALELLDLDAVYTYYGYCNDLLVKLNAYGLRTMDVPIPARYGNEKSKIRYGRFIRKVAPMLFRSFLWRLNTKYMILDFHPLVLFYAAGMVLVPAGLLFGLVSMGLLPFVTFASMESALLAAIVELAGLQFLLSAMAFDAEVDRASTARRRGW